MTLGEKVVFCLPTAGRRTQFFHPCSYKLRSIILRFPVCFSVTDTDVWPLVDHRPFQTERGPPWCFETSWTPTKTRTSASSASASPSAAQARRLRCHCQQLEAAMAFGAARCHFHHRHQHHGKQIIIFRGRLSPGCFNFGGERFAVALNRSWKSLPIFDNAHAALSVCLLIANLIGKPWLVVGSFLPLLTWEVLW